MNALRMVFGWVFLAVLTGAGTFYGMDEIDQRVGLARFHLHEALGITRYTAESTAKSVMPPATGAPTVSPVAPAPAPPETASGVGTTTTPPGSSTAPVPFPPTAPVSPALTPPTSTPAVTPPSYPPSRPSESYVPPVTPASRYPAPVPPSHYTPSPPVARPVPPRVPTTYEAPPRPADYTEVSARLIDLKSRAEAAIESWANIENSLRSMNQPLRPEIKTAIGNVRRYTQAADQALRAGDTAAARRFMDQADKQLQLLQQYRE